MVYQGPAEAFDAALESAGDDVPLAVAAAIGTRRPFLATRNAVGALLRGTDPRIDVSLAAGPPS